MKKFDKFVQEIANEVEHEIRECIYADRKTMYYEKACNNEIVYIEMQMAGNSVDVIDVCILRDDERNSPLVAEAIKQALPDWLEIQEQVEEETHEFNLEEQYRMENYYNL